MFFISRRNSCDREVLIFGGLKWVRLNKSCLLKLFQNGMMALPWFYSKRTDPSDTPSSTNEHLNTPKNIPKYSPRQPHHTSDNHWTSPRQSYNFCGTRESFRVSEGCLRSVWGLSEGCLEFLKMSGSVFWYLQVSVVVWGCLEWCLGVFGWYFGMSELIGDV